MVELALLASACVTGFVDVSLDIAIGGAGDAQAPNSIVSARPKKSGRKFKIALR